VALGRRAVTVSFSRRDDGTRIALDAHDDAPGAWSIALDLRVRPFLTATIPSDLPERLHWALSALWPLTLVNGDADSLIAVDRDGERATRTA